MWMMINIMRLLRRMIKEFIFVSAILLYAKPCFCWGFYGHQKINYQAVFLLPPEMIGFYKTNILFLSDHAVDPDMRRYAVKEEAPRHYIDLDLYGKYPYDSVPRNWNDAVKKFGQDSLESRGIVPWWVQVMQRRLVQAFKDRDQSRILKLSAEIGHYIADAHVPLHASSNHNGQLTGQKGIHAFWESRIPELLADRQWNFFTGQAIYIKSPGDFIWKRVMESGAAADTVLAAERVLTRSFSSDRKFAFEERSGKIIRQYSTAFTMKYDALLHGMVERRMQQAIFAVASFWYTAWVDAGQPDLQNLVHREFTADEMKEFDELSQAWRKGEIQGRPE
jgi:hypothetical protein